MMSDGHSDRQPVATTGGSTANTATNMHQTTSVHFITLKQIYFGLSYFLFEEKKLFDLMKPFPTKKSGNQK